MNAKAFNLFTALIAAILIVLTMLLVNAMIQTELGINSVIQEKDQQSKLESVAEIMQNDTVNLFNYYMRQQIESYIVDNPFEVKTEMNFEEVVKDFEESEFGTTGFISAFSQNVCNNLKLESTAAYQARIDCDKDALRTVLEAAIDAAKNDSDIDYFEVIGCNENQTESVDDCPKGTFYVNLPLDKISQQTYEKLPKIRVTDTTTGRNIQKIMLPKRSIKLYVPIRIFRAITIARAIAHRQTESPLGTSKIEGYFNDFYLGMCDEGSCKPRNDPRKATTGSWNGTKAEEAVCPGVNVPQSDPLKLDLKLDGAGQGRKVNPYVDESADTESIKSALDYTATKKVCEFAEDAVNAGVGDPDELDMKIAKTTVDGKDCYLTKVENIFTPPIETAKLAIIAYGGGSSSNQPDKSHSTCMAVKRITVEVKITETDEKYIVNPAYYAGGTKGIVLRFAHTFKAEDYKNKFLDMKGTWTCETQSTESTGVYQGCSPG